MKWMQVVLFIGLISGAAWGQLPSKAEKLVGTWKYKQKSGYEIWELDGGELRGTAYRVNPKTGDSSKIEDSWIRKTNRNLIYTMKTHSFLSDSVRTNEYDFVGGKRKMKFYNIDSSVPYMVSYSFGFLNRKKLFVKIYYEEGEKPLKLTLTKVQ